MIEYRSGGQEMFSSIFKDRKLDTVEHLEEMCK